jgi:hypothetical protein
VRSTSGIGSAVGFPYRNWLATKRFIHVLRAGGEQVRFQPERDHEHRQPQRVRIAERTGVTEVPADAAGAVPAVDLGQSARYVRHRLVPPDGLETAIGSTPQRRGYPVRVVLHLDERDALLARETG